ATPAEDEWYFLDGDDASAHKDFQQQLEAALLERNPLHAGPADQEKPGQWIANARAPVLQWPGRPDSAGRGQPPGRMPAAQSAAFCIAAADGEIVAVENGSDQRGKHLRRMLEVGIDDAQYAGVALLPSMRNGSGEAALAVAHQQAYTRVRLRQRANGVCDSISTVVVHDQDF